MVLAEISLCNGRSAHEIMAEVARRPLWLRSHAAGSVWRVINIYVGYGVTPLRARATERGSHAAVVQEAETAAAVEEAVRRIAEVSQNGWLLSRRGRSSPANAGGCDAHRDSTTSRFDSPPRSAAGRHGAGGGRRGARERGGFDRETAPFICEGLCRLRFTYGTPVRVERDRGRNRRALLTEICL
jgi:hypothetical protein